MKIKKPGCTIMGLQPGFLIASEPIVKNETRGFPSLPCDRFGIVEMVKKKSSGKKTARLNADLF